MKLLNYAPFAWLKTFSALTVNTLDKTTPFANRSSHNRQQTLGPPSNHWTSGLFAPASAWSTGSRTSMDCMSQNCGTKAQSLQVLLSFWLTLRQHFISSARWFALSWSWNVSWLQSATRLQDFSSTCQFSTPLLYQIESIWGCFPWRRSWSCALKRCFIGSLCGEARTGLFRLKLGGLFGLIIGLQGLNSC